jgi:UDP-glucuronate 4-epimerase
MIVREQKTILVTGAAGFIGFHTSTKLLEQGYKVIGLDNFNDYYDPELKEKRIEILNKSLDFVIERGDITDQLFVDHIFKKYTIDKVCHLAAQGGIQFSIKNPKNVIDNNIQGFLNILESMKNNSAKTIIYASRSSVYGINNHSLFVETDCTNSPTSLYASTKIMNELMAYNYHHLYGLRCTGLRFFTVYGEFGRPDMAVFKFTKNILKDDPISLFSKGEISRDFTYIDDIVDGICAALEKEYDYQIFNLGSGKQTNIENLINIIESKAGKKAKKQYLPLLLGDMQSTLADITKAKKC